jgi:hypothetical protein
VRIVPWIGRVVLAAAVTPSWGCAHGPRRFGKIEHPAPFVRARAVGVARREPDSRAVPALVGRLADEDPVVRLAAHEELRRRTGRDFGYLPWASPEERSTAIDRWRAWLGQAGRSGAYSGGALPTGQSPAPVPPPFDPSPEATQRASNP